MLTERHILLLNRRLDGCLSDEESVEIEAGLRSDPEVHDLYRRMLGLSGCLDQLPSVDPPAELQPAILAEIARLSARRAQSPGLAKRLLAMATSRYGVRYGLSFASGVAVGVIAVFLGVTGPPPVPDVKPTDVIGTIAGDASIDGAHPLVRREFSCDDVSGTVTVLGIAPGVIAIRLSVVSRVEVAAGFSYDRAALHFRGIGLPDASLSRLETSPGWVQATHQGTSEYSFVFAAASRVPQVVGFRLLRDGVLHSDRIEFTPGQEGN